MKQYIRNDDWYAIRIWLIVQSSNKQKANGTLLIVLNHNPFNSLYGNYLQVMINLEKFNALKMESYLLQIYLNNLINNEV